MTRLESEPCLLPLDMLRRLSAAKRKQVAQVDLAEACTTCMPAVPDSGSKSFAQLIVGNSIHLSFPVCFGIAAETSESHRMHLQGQQKQWNNTCAQMSWVRHEQGHRAVKFVPDSLMLQADVDIPLTKTLATLDTVPSNSMLQSMHAALHECQASTMHETEECRHEHRCVVYVTHEIAKDDSQLAEFVQDAVLIGKDAIQSYPGLFRRLANQFADSNVPLSGKEGCHSSQLSNCEYRASNDRCSTPEQLSSLASKLAEQEAAIRIKLAPLGPSDTDLPCSQPDGHINRSPARGHCPRFHHNLVQGQCLQTPQAVMGVEQELEEAVDRAMRAAERLHDVQQHRHTHQRRHDCTQEDQRLEEGQEATALPQSSPHARRRVVCQQTGPGVADDTNLPTSRSGSNDQSSKDVERHMLTSQLQQVLNRQARLRLAWQQGCTAGMACLMKIIAACMVRNIIRHHHMTQASQNLQTILLYSLTTSPDSSQDQQGNTHTGPGKEGAPAGQLQSQGHVARLECLQDCTRKDCIQQREALRSELQDLSQELGTLQAAQCQVSDELAMLLSSHSMLSQQLEDAVEARSKAEQALDEAERKLLMLAEADPAALLTGVSSPEELLEMAEKFESRARAARTAAAQLAAQQEQMCPVCWEHKKRMVFQCGHQTCSQCGDRLTACPICRAPVTIRIKMF